MRKVLFTAALGLALSASWPTAQTSPYDIVIRNGRVLDGSGGPARQVDIGIRGDRIVRVGPIGAADGKTMIDAKGRVVAPGFIDVHSHGLETIGRTELRDARPEIAQGVTFIVGNPDGGGPTDLKQQAATLEGSGGLGVNVALLIGHGSVRTAVLGASEQRAPTADEMARMKAMVHQAVIDGAFGLSSGIFYTPGRYAKTDELVALARESGGVYTSHIRDEGNYDVGVVASVDEVIRVAEQAHVKGIVTHMKALGPDSWGLGKTLVAHINAARARGVQVFADQYPYEASSTSLSAAVLPGETAATIRVKLADPVARAKLLAEAKENIRRRAGAAAIAIASQRDHALEGKHLDQIAKARNVAPEQAAIDIILDGGASIVSFNMSEDDIRIIMKQPWTMTSSDGGLSLPGEGMPHPRNNGAFARKLAVYVRERGVISLERAIRSMTGLSAEVFGLKDRGVIREGAFADVVVFDPAKIIDKATYADPHQLAEGMDWVIVNGVVACRDGQFTGSRSGRVLRPSTVIID
jgi:N-acyl-D-amino-acid deacylase